MLTFKEIIQAKVRYNLTVLIYRSNLSPKVFIEYLSASLNLKGKR